MVVIALPCTFSNVTYMLTVARSVDPPTAVYVSADEQFRCFRLRAVNWSELFETIRSQPPLVTLFCKQYPVLVDDLRGVSSGTAGSSLHFTYLNRPWFWCFAQRCLACLVLVKVKL